MSAQPAYEINHSSKQYIRDAFANKNNNVITIPAFFQQEKSMYETPHKVGDYIRVSTIAEAQSGSYVVQQEQNKKTIASVPLWQHVDSYGDEGISGTTVKGRPNFKRLIADCMAGKITLIYTKSVTRFARNTKECLEIVHFLKTLNPPVGVYFENHNLYSLDNTQDLMLTFLAALAQEESKQKSISVTWGFYSRFAAGIPKLTRSYGHEVDKETKRYVKVPEEAAVIEFMAHSLINGMPPLVIANRLEEAGIPNPAMTRKHKPLESRWTGTAVSRILRNEKLCGDVLCQKTYVVDFLTHKTATNKGQRQKHLVPNYCEQILPRGVWNHVQNILNSMNYRQTYLPDLRLNTEGPFKGWLKIHPLWMALPIPETKALFNPITIPTGQEKE